MLLIETAVLLVVIVIAVAWPGGFTKFEKLEQAFVKASRRRAISVLFAGVLGFGVRIAVLPVVPIPGPGTPDEFGHLLAADTFAHGRLTNPTHPMGVHFETLSAIQQPSYASKYLPAQGLILALGQKVLGNPFWGVCLSLGFMTAAICWALQGWFSPEWALLGTVLVIARICMFSYWANSYWGGALAAAGGALVLGALPRLKATYRARDAWIMGSGLFILANSRPFEGLFLSLPVFVMLGMSLARKDKSERRTACWRTILPILACVFLTLAEQGYYNRRVTGNAFLLPYQLAQRTYYPTPLFFWEPLRPMPAYHHARFKSDMERWELSEYTINREHPLLTIGIKGLHFWLFFFGPLLSVPFVVLLFTLPYGFSWKEISSGGRFLLATACVAFAAPLLPLFFNPGYAAPATALVYAVFVKAILRVRKWDRGGTSRGVALSRAIFAACGVLVLIRLAAGPLHVPVVGSARTWSSVDFQLTDRARIEANLAKTPDRHLVLVRYPGPDPSVVSEWVYNDADIDGSKVVWAHDMGPSQNQELIRYFKDRKIWVVEPGKSPPSLVQYRDDRMAATSY